MEANEGTYKTINSFSEGVFRDKGSKFIAYAFPILFEDQIKGHLQQLRNDHPKARHWCWAMRLSPDRQVFRFSDDGEPAGSAGRPILNVLLSADVTNLLVVVVRYFGGTLLGVPGLINAYKLATQEALKANLIIQKSVLGKYQLEFDYLGMNDVMKIIKTYDITIQEQNFDNICQMTILIPKNISEEVMAKLNKLDVLKLSFLDWI